MGDQQFGNGAITAAGGLIEWRRAGFVARFNGGALFDEKLRQRQIAAGGGDVQRGLACVIAGADLGAMGHQELGHRQVVLDAGVGQRLGAALGVTGFHAGAMLDQVKGDFAVAAPDRVVQRGGAHFVGGIDARAACDFELNLLQVAGLDGLVEAASVERRSQRDSEANAPNPRIAPLLPLRWRSAGAREPSARR